MGNGRLLLLVDSQPFSRAAVETVAKLVLHLNTDAN